MLFTVGYFRMDIGIAIRQEKFTDPYQKCIINLFYTSNYFRDAHLSVFKPFDIQGQHFNILRILRGKYPASVSPGYIKDVMLDKGRDLTRLIDKLAMMGWVNRSICPENRRKMDIRLTEEGLKAVDEISLQLHSYEKELRTLTDDEFEMLSSLLDKMRG